MTQVRNPFTYTPQYVYEHHVFVGKGLPKPVIPPCIDDHKAIKATTNSSLIVIITYDDGCQQIRKAGTLSWRNNNPGNVTVDLKHNPHAFGAIGFNNSHHHDFAIYPNEEAGQSAIVSLLRENKYQVLTLNEAFYKYAPSQDANNTAAYVRFVVEKTGIQPETPMNSLNQAQMLSIANAIKIHEGWRPGLIEWKKAVAP